jgi:hypothetical protein
LLIEVKRLKRVLTGVRALLRDEVVRLVADERGHGIGVRQAARRVRRARLRQLRHVATAGDKFELF